MSNSSQTMSPAASSTHAPVAAPVARAGLLGLTALALVLATGCAGLQRRAVSRRPTVVLASEPGTCRPVALVDIDNPGHCRVQLVARGADREYLGASTWIPAGQHDATYALPERFSWIVLEVDPLCDSSVGRIRYRAARTVCEPNTGSLAAR